MSRETGEDWAAALDRVQRGDRHALAKLTRLVNSFLSRWGAYDLRDDWEDVVQDVLSAALRALEAGELRDRAAVAAYMKSTTRFKFVDRLKARTRQHAQAHQTWDDVVEQRLEPAAAGLGADRIAELRRALEALPEAQRRVVAAVHLRGETYEEAAESTGTPLGTLKRQLREGLASLRRTLEASP